MVIRKDLLVTFFLITVVPFCVFVHLAPLGDFWPFFLACSAVTICAVIALGIANFKQKSLLVSPFVGVLAAFFLFLCVLTVIQKVSLNDQITLLIYAVIVLLTALLAVQLVQKSQTQYYDYLAFMLVIGGVIESIGAIAIEYRLMGIDYWMLPALGRLIGFIAQPNQLAIYIMVAFLALSYLTFRRVIPIIVALLLAGLFGFILLGSGSRAILIYLVCLILTTLFCLIKSKEKSYTRFIFLILSLVVGAIIYYFLPTILGWFSDVSSQPVVSEAVNAYGRSAASESFRFSEISKAFALLSESPLLGVGFGNYAVKGFWFGIDASNYIFIGDLTLHSHNLFAQILAEFGLVGFIALLIVLVYILVCFWRIPKTLQWWLVFTVFCVYFVNSMLEYVFWRMHFVPLFVLMIVPLLSPTIKLRFSRLISPVVWIVVAGVFVMVANGSLNTYAKSFFYNKDSALMDKTDYQIFISATDDLIWGREIQQQEFVTLSPQIIDFTRQQRITANMLAWRPYAPIIVNKIQLLLLSGQVGDLEKYSYALLKAYPEMVPDICNYFDGFNDIPNSKGLRIVKKTLNCKVVLSNHK